MSDPGQSLKEPSSTVLPSKRTSLGEVSSNKPTLDRSGKMKDINPPKPSAIPRPNTTPTKETSFLTPYGFRSPSSPSRSKSVTPPSSTRRVSEPITISETKTSSKPIFKSSMNNINSRKELEELKQKIDAREKELAELRSSILSLRTSKQQYEFDNQSLEDNLSSLNKKLRIKSNELEHLSERKEEVSQDIKRKYELKVKEMQVDNETSMYELEKNYTAKIDEVLKIKVGKSQQEKSQLQSKITQLKNDIQNSEINFQNDLKTLRKQYDQNEKKLQDFMSETRESLENDCKELDEKEKTMIKEKIEIEATLGSETKSKEQLFKQLQESEALTEDASKHFDELQEKLKQLEKSLVFKQAKIREIKSDTEWKISQKLHYDEELIKEEVIRRRLHDKMQELKGNIRVFCRVRPPQGAEVEQDPVDIQVPDNDEEEQEIVLKDPKPVSSSGFNANPSSSSNSKKSYKFKFDRIFQMDSTNQEIFEEISQLVQSALDGFNVCIFAYGQTGSGKTYTMSNKDGMIPRAVEQIFETANKLKARGWNYKIYGEFLEIYNENINDLLGNPNNIDKTKLEIKHDTVNQKTTVSDLTTIELINPQMVNDVLAKALKNRSIASTKANERSSRSHSVFTIKIFGENLENSEKIEGNLNLIDLAGSERLSHSQASGDRLKETQSINKSLSCLGDVIYALGDSIKDSRKHIPFRNSKLTYLLQYSLGGNSKTLMFVNISPFNKHFNETINSLRFATKVNSTKLGAAKKNNSPK